MRPTWIPVLGSGKHMNFLIMKSPLSLGYVELGFCLLQRKDLKGVFFGLITKLSKLCLPITYMHPWKVKILYKLKTPREYYNSKHNRKPLETHTKNKLWEANCLKSIFKSSFTALPIQSSLFVHTDMVIHQRFFKFYKAMLPYHPLVFPCDPPHD